MFAKLFTAITNLVINTLFILYIVLTLLLIYGSYRLMHTVCDWVLVFLGYRKKKMKTQFVNLNQRRPSSSNSDKKSGTYSLRRILDIAYDNILDHLTFSNDDNDDDDISISEEIPTKEQTHQKAHRLRTEASSYYDLKIKAAADSQAAYRANKKALAAVKSKRKGEYHDLYVISNAAAVRVLMDYQCQFHSRCEEEEEGYSYDNDGDEGKKGSGGWYSGTIDLHGLYVNEAVFEVKKFIDYHSNRNNTSTCAAKKTQTVNIITGRGNNSVNNASKLKPAIETLLRDRKLGSREVNNGGCFVVEIDVSEERWWMWWF